MARAVAQEQKRQAVRAYIGASRCGFRGIGAQPDLRLRDGRKHGAQRFILKRLPCGQKKHDAQTGVRYVGRQSVKKLVGQNQGVSNVELSGEDIKAFERVARKYGVDYAVKKVKGDAPRFLIFFKARDADALNAALSEYTDQKMRGKEHSKLREKLRAPIEQIITHKKQREQSR